MRRWSLVLPGLLLGCGPVLGVGADDGSSTSSGTTSGASSSGREDSASAPEPGTPCCVPFCALAEPDCPAGASCVDALSDPVVGLCQAG